MAWRPILDDLRGVLLASLGVAPSLLLAACGGSNTPSDDDGHSVTTDPSGDGSSVDDEAEGTSDSGSPSTGNNPNPTSGFDESDSESDTDTEDESDSEDEGDGDGDPIKLDLPAEPDLPPPKDCTVTEVPLSTLDEHPECEIVPPEDPFCWGVYWGCVALEPGQTCEQTCVGSDCVIDWTSCDGDYVYDFPNTICGPYEVDGMCCSLADIYQPACGSDGRPFVVAGVARKAELRAIGRDSIETHARLPERVREQLSKHWTEIAKAEHASVASFAQFAARLLALAAPPALIGEALAAASDEVRHAELALARASELAGRPLEFGPLDTRGAARASESLEESVLACVREGCIGETLAALELQAAALACEDAELAASLRAIAADEARHAALAWRFVRWALVRQPSLAPAVAALFDSLAPAAAAPEHFDASERELLRAHGYLLASERRSVQLDALHQVLRPCAAALLGFSPCDARQ